MQAGVVGLVLGSLVAVLAGAVLDLVDAQQSIEQERNGIDRLRGVILECDRAVNGDGAAVRLDTEGTRSGWTVSATS